MPKILHIVWNLIRGGTEGQCARIAMGMAGRGYEQRVAVFRREGFFLDKVEQACGPVYDIGIRHMVSLDTFQRLQQFQQFQRLERFALVHCWDADAAIFGSLAAKWAGVPYITSRRDMGEIYPRHKLFLMRQADRGAQAVVVNAEAIGVHFAGKGLSRSKLYHIPNILDLDEFERLPDVPGSLDLPVGRRIGTVARLDPEKDVATFIRAGRGLVSAYPDLQLVIVGDGPERGALENLTRELGLTDHVLFTGEQTSLGGLLKSFEVGVLTPNSNEGLSNTILEYMAAARPVVATDCGGNRELVEDGVTGYVVPSGDAEALTDKLRKLLDNPKLAEEMGKRGRKKVKENHAPEKVLDQFEDLYRSVVGS